MAKPGLLIALLVAAVLLTGCAHDEEVSIAPLAPAAGRVDPGLGPGTRALSSGPGYKGSPSWRPGRGQDRVHGRRLRGGQADDLGRAEALDHEGFRRQRHRVDLGRYPDDTRRGVPLRDRGGHQFPVQGDDAEGRFAGAGEGRRREYSAMSPGPEGGGLIFALDRGTSESSSR